MDRVKGPCFTTNIPFEIQSFDSEDDYEEWLAKKENERVGGMNKLDGIDCPICRNKGYIALWDEETKTRYQPDCSCMQARDSIRRLDKSDVCRDWREKTFETYRVTDKWQEILKERVQRYLADQKRRWLYVSGQSGCGKTHLCTAALVELVKREALRGEYIRWIDMAEKMAALRFSDRELDAFKSRLTMCDILYIDDLFKKMRNASVSEREFDITLSILDARYKNPNLMTIISSEGTMEDLGQMDEAFAGRIHERCGKHIVQVRKEAGRNYRLRKDELI